MNPIKPTVIAAAIALAACSGSKKEQPKLDYQSENRKIVNLEVPPDLTNPNQGNLYQLPAGTGAVRASDITRRATAGKNTGQAVLSGIKGVKMERDGNQRWLSVSDRRPAEIWPLLKAFWQESGFTIASEEPAIGQMETDWAENRAKLGGGGLRSILEKIGLGGIYSTSERDKFIVRVEKAKNGGTDIFFAHKGMSETYADRDKDTTMWQPRANDPNLEAAFLARFMQYLGADEQQIQNQLERADTAGNAAGLAKLENGSLLISGDYERNWRRTALALDRVGLTVTGQNTEKHAFLVQPAQNESASVQEKKPGLIGRLFGKKAKAPAPLPDLIVFLQPVSGGARLQILNKDGSRYTGAEASTWLSRLHTELR
ncbi:lipoprotein [Kingella potus]|uniref:Lipoprotein n=1 Tax=Kingella potus TaxID=265175 RepID=A0A377R390_9NEIS|nr:outer membrane protein assembly factor BamC [Kingella potus]STR02674.1 lipoprotein [Kingella potus]